MIERFEANRSRLRAVAYRMLGSSAEAEDAVQEAWLRLNRTGADGIDNLDAWLTTVVGRVCLDMLRARTARREDAYEAEPPTAATPTGPEEETLLADSVGVALLVVLETLTPVERLAFVLHDTFGVSFEEIAPIVGRSPTAARQLASRARRRVRQQQHADRPADRRIVDAFLTASRAGDFTTLLSLLDPDVRMRGDEAAQRLAGSTTELAGSTVVAQFFSGRAQGARPALIDGLPGLWVAAEHGPRIAILLTVVDGRIAAMEAIADPDTLRDLEIVQLDS
jgi:RNA polymerase sigma factor (sigma-70 family)